MARSTGKPLRQVNQLTLVSTPYVTQLMRTLASVRSIREKRAVSMAEVFRDVVEAAAPSLEDEIRRVLGEEAVVEIRRAREEESGPDEPTP